MILAAIFRCKKRNLQERETPKTELCRQQVSVVVKVTRNHFKNCYALGRWASTKTINLLRSGWHSPLHYSICWEFSHPCFPLQRIFTTSAVQTPVSLSGNHWSVGWSCCPASLCYILDVRVSRTLEPLSIRQGRRLRHKLCIDFSVFDDDDGHKRGQTSRLVVGTEIQTNCNFEAYVYYCNLPFVEVLNVITVLNVIKS